MISPLRRFCDACRHGGQARRCGPCHSGLRGPWAKALAEQTPKRRSPSSALISSAAVGSLVVADLWNGRAGIPGVLGSVAGGSWTALQLHLRGGQGRPGDACGRHQPSLRGTGPRAVIVKPGPTDTAMTAGMTKGALWPPEAVAAVVRKPLIAAARWSTPRPAGASSWRSFA